MSCQQVQEFEITHDEKDEEISNLKEQLQEAKLRIPTDTVESISLPRPVTVVETEKPTGTDGEARSERSIEIIHNVPRIPLIPTAVAPVLPGSFTHERIPNDKGKKRRGRAPPLDKFSEEDPTVRLDDWLPSLSWVADWYGWLEQETLIQLAGH